MDSRTTSSGFCPATNTYRSLRPPLPLPPESASLSAAAYAFSFLHPSPPPTSGRAHPAFVDSVTGATLSYPDLLARVRSLAAALSSRFGLSAGRVAFVLSPPRLEVPVLYLALLSIGAPVSPANPASTPDELARLLALSRPSVVFATSDTAGTIPSHIPTVLLDSPQFRSLLAFDPAEDDSPPDEVPQSDAAAVLYSSGTTGRVKGVVLTHRNLIAALAQFTTRAAAATATVQMLTVPLFHIYGFLFLLKTVAVRETTVLQTSRFDVRKTLAAVERFQVSQLSLAPPALLAIVKLYENTDGKKTDEERSYDLSSLQVVSCGGAPVRVELCQRFMARFPRIRLAQGYGLTESTGGIARSLDWDESRCLGSTGRLASGFEAKIIDPVTGMFLAPGLHGELWLKGPTIMKGYIGDQEATSEILNSEGWLRTGDICYINEDGLLFVIDRLKDLIKYKGYQVPPAELEDLLQKHPDIIEAAVIPYPDEEAGQVPVAIILRESGSTLNEDQIMKYVKSKVAPYKRIHRVLFVEAIPKNAAGKILKKDLIRLLFSKTKSNL